jgi:hypothetical protein
MVLRTFTIELEHRAVIRNKTYRKANYKGCKSSKIIDIEPLSL